MIFFNRKMASKKLHLRSYWNYFNGILLENLSKSDSNREFFMHKEKFTLKLSFWVHLRNLSQIQYLNLARQNQFCSSILSKNFILKREICVNLIFNTKFNNNSSNKLLFFRKLWEKSYVLIWIFASFLLLSYNYFPLRLCG